MSSFEPLSPEAAAKILAKGSDKPKSRKKKKEVDTSVRTYENWFALPHTNGNCANPDCKDPRLKKNGGNTTGALVATVSGAEMDRYCFLEGWNVS